MSLNRYDDSESKVYFAIRAPRRRSLIEHLSRGAPRSKSELAKEIAADVYNMEIESLTNNDYRNVYTSLNQTHLPCLIDAGIVTCGPRKEKISPGPNYEFARQLVNVTEDMSP